MKVRTSEMTRKVKEMRAAIRTKMGSWLGRVLRVLVSSSGRRVLVCGFEGWRMGRGEQLTSPGVFGVSDGEEDQVLDALVDGLGLLLDDGEVAVDSLEGFLAELVGLVDVGLGILVGSLEVGLHGLAEAGVGAVYDINGLLAVGVGFEGVDAAGDDGVGGDVREGLGGGRAVAVDESV